MTTRELARLIGQHGMLRIEQLGVPVEVLDARTVWGRTDVLVAVPGGVGEQWVDVARVTLA